MKNLLIKLIFLCTIASLSPLIAHSHKSYNNSYSACHIDPTPAEDYSEWVNTTDMQLSFDNRPMGTYWVHLEGRNHNGLTQFRWIQRNWNKNTYSTWKLLSGLTRDKFFNEDFKLQQSGYKRVSLQVFTDEAEIQRHQVLWVLPSKAKVTEADYEFTFSKLDPHKKVERDNSFSAWKHYKVSNAYFHKIVPTGQYPMITEIQNSINKRRIYLKSHGGFWTRCGYQLPSLIKYHEQYLAKNYKLLTLTQYTNSDDIKLYSATWVRKSWYSKALEQLEQYGIGEAKISKRLRPDREQLFRLHPSR